MSNRLRSRVLTAGINQDEAAQAHITYLGTDQENLTKAQTSLAEAGVTTLIGVRFRYPEGNVQSAQEFELI